MQVIHDDLKNLPHYIPCSKVDGVTYFKVDKHSNLNESRHIFWPRHEISTENLEEICTVAQR